MSAALERAVWPGVDEYLSKRPNYAQFSFFPDDDVCVFATFVPGKGLWGMATIRDKMGHSSSQRWHRW
jgi:hypothetical protein